LGKRWGELEEATRVELLKRAQAVNGITGDSTTSPGECIVDFWDTVLSIPGKINDEFEIEIEDEAIFYCSSAE